MIEYETIETGEMFGFDDLERICKIHGQRGQAVKVISCYNGNGDNDDEISGVHEVRALVEIDVNGKPVRYEERHSNSELKVHFTFKDGERHGFWHKFDDQCRHIQRLHFKEGELHGYQVFYVKEKVEHYELWENGNIKYNSLERK